MVTTIIPTDVPLNPYNFTTSAHHDFSRFPNPVIAHHATFRENLLKARRTFGEQVLADLFDVAFADLWVIEQCPVHNRFPDFFVPAFNLAIEVDGGYHRKGSSRHRDVYKDWALTKRGFNVFHIDNRILVENCWIVISSLKEFIERLLDPILSAGPFCPWGWKHYLQYKPNEESGFSLANPNDLISIRWEISMRYPSQENCPSNWCVSEREASFRGEADTLDLAGLVYECDPGSSGKFLYPRCSKPASLPIVEVDRNQRKSISATLCEELGRLSNRAPDKIKLNDHLFSDLGLDASRTNEIRKALEDAFDTGIPFNAIKNANYVCDLIRYFWFRNYSPRRRRRG